ncbi:hypothetical protein CFIMG_008663RA00001 [Ceratocystis fimbriata CBS 114723]|uniref:Protein kinase domain-containing protein n=1 Tax=Ceratocystis fimbriata CBS 114723 TaxID=1035309 RepID=A0A2C5WZC6_9PEZI|nr:hypothetical protein CFIMG_008663RA00001 [Ceratocystis fimbriata CBS 114723]
MIFIAANSKVPVSKVHDHVVDPKTQKRCIVMDYIPGINLEELLPSLTLTEKKTISKRIKDAIDELRRIPAQGYLGSLTRAPYADGVLSTPDDNPLISGALPTSTIPFFSYDSGSQIVQM